MVTDLKVDRSQDVSGPACVIFGVLFPSGVPGASTSGPLWGLDIDVKPEALAICLSTFALNTLPIPHQFKGSYLEAIGNYWLGGGIKSLNPFWAPGVVLLS